MKFFFKFVCSAITVLMVAGCHKSVCTASEPSVRDYKFSDLDSLAIESLTTVGHFGDSCNFAIPTGIKLIDSKSLVILDSRAERQIKILDLESGKVSEMLPHGHGPEEIISAISLSSFDNKIYVGGANENKICIIDSLQSDSPSIRTFFTTDFPFLNILPLDTQKILTLPVLQDNTRFIELDILKNSKTSVGNFPIDNPDANNAVFQADLALTPDGKKIIAVDRSWGIVEIIGADDFSIQNIIRCPGEIQPTIEKVTTQIGTQYVQNPMGIVLANVSTDDSGFYTGYIGSRVDKPETLQRNISKILYFNYDGSGGKVYTLPSELTSFCVDPVDKRLYGLNLSPEGKISVVSTLLP